jgi:hypothetical protein
VQNVIASQGGVSSYQAGDGLTGGPFVVIIADAKSKSQAERTVSLAMKYAETELNTRQQNLDAPPSTFIGTQVVVAATPATTKIGSKVKAGGVTFALGLVLSLAAAFAFESIMTNRRRRKDDESGDIVDERPSDLDQDVDDVAVVEGAALATHKMVPAPPPRSLPQPVRSGGPRQVPRPQVGSIGERASGRREPYGPSPAHKPHPAKPRVLPTPVPGGKPAPVPNNKPASVPNPVTNGSSSGSSNNGHGAGNNGSGSGNGGGRDWPRADFRSPDSSAG